MTPTQIEDAVLTWLNGLSVDGAMNVLAIPGDDVVDQTSPAQPDAVRPAGPHVAVWIALDDGYSMPVESRRVSTGQEQVAPVQSREVRIRLVGYQSGADVLLRAARVNMARRTGRAATLRAAGVVPYRVTSLIDETALVGAGLEQRWGCDLWAYVGDAPGWTNVSPADTIATTVQFRDDGGNTVAPDASFTEST